MKNFWSKLNKPFYVLAPMADVTDCAFRHIITKNGKPDVLWSEFVSADGLCSAGREKLLIDLKYGEDEHPIVAQIFGSKIENIKTAASLCEELGFDGVDINMGCPDKSIEKQGAGAGMIKNPELAIAIINAAKEGASGLPVSVKTRIGYNKNEIETWIRTLLKEDLAVLTVHLRTRKEMSKVPAHWELMPRIVEIRDEICKEKGGKGEKTLIIGNGDVMSVEEAREKCEKYGCDGIMLGRAIFGNPWLFKRRDDKFSVSEGPTQYSGKGAGAENLSSRSLQKEKIHNNSFSLKEKLEVMISHTKLFEEKLGEHKNFAIMKKHYKAYVNGFEGAKELRMKLMETNNAKQVEDIVNDFLKKMV